jgi:uncharacterized protein (DUF342 family)
MPTHRNHKSTDGSFDLYYRKGYAYLIVYPPHEGGKPVYPEEVESRMKMLGVPSVRTKIIREIIEDSSGKPVRLVEWPEGQKLASRTMVTISDDEMSAWVTVTPPKKGAAPPTAEDIKHVLGNHGICFGIDEEAIGKLLSRRDFDRSILVAEGEPPVDERSSRIQYHFNTNRGKPYLEMDFGRINLKELNFIENKEQDDLLAELLPPIEPKNGRTVTGTVLSAQRDTATVELEAGENTRLSHDKQRLYAECDGNVKLREGVVIIEPVVTVENVNYETGNIYFDGSVVVKNGVADGFIVEAGGDIQVSKGVGKATLKADGNILLKTGINGNKAGEITCGGNLFAKYIESSTVSCHGNIFVEEAIMHSTISSWKHCVLNGRRSEVIAGSLIVGGSLWCKKLGSLYEATTHVAMGIAPDLLIEYRNTKKELEEKQNTRNKEEEQIDRLKHAIEEGNDEPKIVQALEQLQASFTIHKTELHELHQRVSALKNKLRASRRSMVVVEDIMYKGVVIRFGTLEYRAPDNGVRKTIIKTGENDIVESGFNPYERPKLIFDEESE